jgi:hypothetical protein
VGVETFIVRIYRRDAKTSTRIEGVVEEAGTNRATSFHSIPELVRLLDRRGAGAKPPKRKARKP